MRLALLSREAVNNSQLTFRRQGKRFKINFDLGEAIYVVETGGQHDFRPWRGRTFRLGTTDPTEVF